MPTSSSPAGLPSYGNSDTLKISHTVVRESQISRHSGFVSAPNPKMLVSSAGKPFVVITDQNVNRLYTHKMVAQLKKQSCNIVDVIVLPASEQAKSMKVYTDCLYRLENNTAVTGDVTLVALGGAVVSNVTGFLAATLKRGVRFVSMPTTLLAQCDGCISFKQAVNGAVAKNQFGAFYSPSNIILDMKVLDTLKPRNFLDGFGEVIKHALCQDEDMVIELENLDVDAMIANRALSHPLIWKAVQCKLECMRNCPPENHAVLQYGHQYGHGVEKAAHFRYGHGECVGLGMVATDYVGTLMGFNDHKRLQRTKALVNRFRLPVYLDSDVSLTEVWDAMVHDKAYENNQHRINFAEPLELNHEFIVIPDERVRQGLSYISTSELMFHNGAVVPKIAMDASEVTSSKEVIDAFHAGLRSFMFTRANAKAQKGLRRILKETLALRKDLTVISSLTPSDASDGDLQTLCVQSLAAIGVDYVDLVLLDCSFVSQDDSTSLAFPHLWEVMEGLHEAGLARNIGIANCTTTQLENLVSHCNVKPVCCHLGTVDCAELESQLLCCEELNIRAVAHLSCLQRCELSELSQNMGLILQEPRVSVLDTTTDTVLSESTHIMGDCFWRTALDFAIAKVPLLASKL